MLIFDGDYPMAYGALDLDRDLTLPLAEVRANGEESEHRKWPHEGTMASLPECRAAGMTAALVKVVARIRRPDSPIWGYSSAENAYAAGQAAVAYYRILHARDQARIITSRRQLVEHVATWESADAYDNLPLGLVMGLEGTDPVLAPEQVHEWWEQGVRVASLAHYGISTYAHGTGRPGGLLEEGPALLREMDACGMILDLTHTSDEAFWQALEAFTGPVLASHQNCRALVPGERQFSDEQLRAILERGAVIGASMDTWMLYAEGKLDWGGEIPDRRSVFSRDDVTLENLADHVDHVCQLAGNVRQAAIGGDTDGQSGRDGAPADVDSVVDYQKLSAILRRRGYCEEDVAGVMYRNWCQFYQRHLPEN